jgi:hypothetical protein
MAATVTMRLLSSLSRNFGVAQSRENWRLALTRSRSLPRTRLLRNRHHHRHSLHFFLSNYITSLPGAHSSDPFTMTDKLPPMLLNLFAPRPPLRWVEPSDHAPEKRCTPKISGIGQYLQAMKEYKDNDGYVPTDSWLQKRDRKKLEKKEKQEKLLTEGINQCTSPHCARLFLACPHLIINKLLTSHRQTQRRPQSSGRRLQDALRRAPRLWCHLGRSRTRVRPLRSHRTHPYRRRRYCAS